jgi:Uma2 family endonuclease
MAAATEPLLITVEQFREMPQREHVKQELRWGQIVTLPPPKIRHAKIQSRLVRLLRPKAEHLGVVEPEVAFRALPEYDLRIADVAFVSRARWDAADDNDNLHGAPEMVIEVLSPSNTPNEIREKATLCLSTGAQEFWIVDPVRKRITVMRPKAATAIYECEDRMPLHLFGGELPVRDIFE